MNKRVELGHGCHMELSSKAELVCPGSGDRVALTPTEYKILCYLVEQANLAVYLESIARYLWGANFDADNRDPENIKSHITRIRNKLGKLCPELKESLETNYGYGSYTYKLQTKEPISKKDPVSPASAENTSLDETMRLCDQVDALVWELEAIREKCKEAAHEGGVWRKIYERQFEAVNYKLERIFEELQRKRDQAEEIRHRAVQLDEWKRNSDSPLPGGFSYSLMQIPSVEAFVGDEARRLAGELSDIRTRMDSISDEIDSAVKDRTAYEGIGENTVRIMTFRQLTAVISPDTKAFYDAKEIAGALKKNDYALYPGLAEHPQLAGDYEKTWAKHLQKNQESFKYLVDDSNRIVGNFSFLALTEEQCKAILAGTLLEEDLEIGKTASLSTAGVKSAMYILNFSVNDKYATLEAKNKLKEAFFTTLLEYAEYDICFEKIIINILDPSQEPDFKAWGFTEQAARKGVKLGKLFSVDLIPYPQKLDQTLSNNRLLKDVNKKVKEIYNTL